MTVIAWEETWPIWQLWDRIGNQWRVGVGGATALDYNPMFTLLERMELEQEDYDSLFDGIRSIEAEVLSIWAEQREEAQEEARRRK